MNMLSTIFFGLFFCSQIRSQNITFHPSDKKLRPFVETLENVVRQLEEITNDGWERLDLVKGYLKHCKNYHKKLMSDRKTLKNPVNRFTFVYSLTKGYDSVQQIINEKLVFKKDTSLRYPSVEDLELNVVMLSRLQRFYKLNVTQLAAGILNTSYSESGKVYVEHFSKMTSSDCFTIGEIMDKYKMYKLSVEWFVVALELYNRDKVFCDFDKRKIYYSLLSGYKTLDDSKNMLKWAREIISFSNDYLDIVMANQEITSRQSILDSEETVPAEENTHCRKKKFKKTEEVRKCMLGEETSNYRKHCRGEMEVPTEITWRLNCWYSTGYHPFLRLAPIRTEQLYVTPDIFLHHDVITQTEIDNITSIEELEECTYFENVTCVNNSVAHCIMNLVPRNCMSKTVGSTAASITQRIFDLTGLWSPVDDAIATYYSNGNYFLTHSDSARLGTYTACSSKLNREVTVTESEYGHVVVENQEDPTTVFSECLYRVQTVLFYLSDEMQGGATVFPSLGITVFPKKGSALSWTTTYPPVTHDLTCHAACPVLRGNKWVLTKWVNFDGNELRRPCVHQFPNGLSMFTPPPVSKKRSLNICSKRNTQKLRKTNF